jgi:GH24 family phage-related lysozyme (muramidase)
MSALRKRLRYLRDQIRRVKRRIRKARIQAAAARPSGLSKNGAHFIAEFEGFFAEPYNDPAGHCTIGYGTLLHTGNCTRADRKEWGTITEAKAIDMLRTEADNAWRVIEELVTVPLNQNKADALISFAYNVGVGAFMSSTLLKRINEKAAPSQIRYEFGRWVKAGGQTLPGLVRRRAAEADLYFTP